METDIPLRTLTEACAADLLSLLGVPQAAVLEVLSLDMPATSRRLDNLLLLRDRAGNEWLHLVEWQGYRISLFPWRLLSYLGWLGEHRRERPIGLTVVYLQRGDDMGDWLRQEIAGRLSWELRFHCVRLWEEDAVAAVQSGQVGLAVLSPLMRNTTTALVEKAGHLVLSVEQDRRRQADLLSVLGALAEPLVAPDRFIEMFERERRMESKLFELLMHDKLEEERSAREAQWKKEWEALEAERAREREALEAERAREREALEAEREALKAERARAVLQERLAALEAERAREQVALVAERERTRLARALEDAIAGRFPTAPVALVTKLHDVHDPEHLGELLRVALHAPDLATIERAVAEAAG